MLWFKVAPSKIPKRKRYQEKRFVTLLGSGDKTIWYCKDTKSWKAPHNPRYVPYHIGVFGATESGKSFLARYQLMPILKGSGLAKGSTRTTQLKRWVKSHRSLVQGITIF